MPDILRILPTGGDYRAFTVDLASGDTKVIGNTYLIHDTWCIAFNCSNAAALQGLTAGGSIYGASVTTAGVGVVYIYHAEKILIQKKQATGEGFNIGDNVYIDPTDSLVSPNAVSGYIKIGIAVREAAETAARVMIDLKGEGVGL